MAAKKPNKQLELQLTNEELETTNDKLRVRSDELTKYREFVQPIIGSLAAGIITVDRRLCVTSWNRWFEATWGLRENEVLQQPLMNLDVGLRFANIRADLLATLDENGDSQEIRLNAINRRGKGIAF